MELVCEKYKETMDASEARCRHPKEYCKFRSSCMIHFLAKESGRSGDEEAPEEADADDRTSSAG